MLCALCVVVRVSAYCGIAGGKFMGVYRHSGGVWCVVRALRGRKKRGGFKFKLAVNGLWHT